MDGRLSFFFNYKQIFQSNVEWKNIWIILLKKRDRKKSSKKNIHKIKSRLNHRVLFRSFSARQCFYFPFPNAIIFFFRFFVCLFTTLFPFILFYFLNFYLIFSTDKILYYEKLAVLDWKSTIDVLNFKWWCGAERGRK